MTLTLGGIALNPDMVWREQFQSQKVAQSVRRLLGGAPYVFAGSIPSGYPITLSATEVNGTLVGIIKKSVVDEMRALADVAGGQSTLVMQGTSYTVVFRHDEPPAVDMRPIRARPGHSYSANDLFRGDIKLLTV